MQCRFIYFLNNNMALAHCVNNSEKGTQGVKTALLYNFLTLIKFNFDSLSRKIKNSCLVIKKIYYKKEDIRMKNIKTILIAVLSFMLLFSISCKNEDKTEEETLAETKLVAL